jgi:hypothetical protein
VATGSLRFVVIVALIAGGVLLIARAFPEASNSALAGDGSPKPSETGSPSASSTEGADGGQQQQPTSAQGVKVAVYNGTFQTGLAAETALKLEQRFGVKIDDKTSILDAEAKPVDQTAIYYATPDDKAYAELLARGYFKKHGVDPKIAKFPAGFKPPSGVQLAVYVGTDFALQG